MANPKVIDLKVQSLIKNEAGNGRKEEIKRIRVRLKKIRFLGVR